MRRVRPAEAKHNIWNTRQAAAWSGIPYMHLLRMAKEGIVPAIPLGDPDQTKKRKYLIPRAAFVQWFETLRPAAEKSDNNGAHE